MRAEAGEVLVEHGERGACFYLVESGAVEVRLPTAPDTFETVTRHGPGEFVGELNVLSGRASTVRAEAAEPNDLVRVAPEAFARLLSGHGELSVLLTDAFVARRLDLLERGGAAVQIVGPAGDARVHRLTSFLTASVQPHRVLEAGSGAAVELLTGREQGDAADVVALCGFRTLLASPEPADLAECLGFNDALDEGRVHDVAVVGAGPGGLAAAVYAASEGLDTVVLGGVRAGRAGGLEQPDRELPRVSLGALRQRAGRARVHAGAEVRLRAVVRAAGGAARVRRRAVRAARRRPNPARPCRRRRERGAVPEARRRGARRARGRGGVLLGHERRGRLVPGPGRRRDRWRELGRPSRRVPGPASAPGAHAGALGHARGLDVGVPDDADRGLGRHRGALRRRARGRRHRRAGPRRGRDRDRRGSARRSRRRRCSS